MSGTKLFRAEAIAHQQSHGRRAELITLDPAATAWGFRLLCAGMAAIALFLLVGQLREYASGPAVVRIEGGQALTASQSGVVTEVRVHPGDRVRKGDVLVRFDASMEQSEQQAAQHQFDAQLAKLLLAPEDPMTREALVELRSRRDLAREQLARRVIQAPQDGVVGDVRVRVGQLVEPGLSMIELQGAASSATVTALLPGRYRPMLQAGLTLRFEMDGFHHLTHELRIDRVGDQIVGPREAARYVGRDLADAFQVDGPVVMIQARLPRTSFEMDGERFDFSNGMLGKAEAVVRTDPIVFTFLPSLKQWSSGVMIEVRSLLRTLLGEQAA